MECTLWDSGQPARRRQQAPLLLPVTPARRGAAQCGGGAAGRRRCGVRAGCSTETCWHVSAASPQSGFWCVLPECFCNLVPPPAASAQNSAGQCLLVLRFFWECASLAARFSTTQHGAHLCLAPAAQSGGGANSTDAGCIYRQHEKHASSSCNSLPSVYCQGSANLDRGAFGALGKGWLRWAKVAHCCTAALASTHTTFESSAGLQHPEGVRAGHAGRGAPTIS